MCLRRFAFARYPIVLRYPPGRPDKRESILAIGCPLPLRSNHAPDRKKLRDRVNAYRCKYCLWRIAGHPSNADSRKRRWAKLFVTRNAQSVRIRLGYAASEAREHGCDLAVNERHLPRSLVRVLLVCAAPARRAPPCV